MIFSTIGADRDQWPLADDTIQIGIWRVGAAWRMRVEPEDPALAAEQQAGRDRELLAELVLNDIAERKAGDPGLTDDQREAIARRRTTHVGSSPADIKHP